ncbi:hypothetical protein ACIBG4_24150 [Nonomuraea sp. NPDC050383]|uniref:hypothetical protein n=1 Tax=Nonomuraea sp. NPDC050383 TaxID=3364362 RepID=UPI00378AECBC
MAALVVLATACTPESDLATTPAPPAQPVVDAAPYVCKLIPEQAFRMVSGVTGPLAERTDGSEGSGECWAPDTAPRPLEVGWLRVGNGTTQEGLDFTMEDRRQVYGRYDGLKLPADLGDGLAAYVPAFPFEAQPYRVSAKFPCGGIDRIIDIYLARVAKGRDAIKDLTDLMRIAQKRYGVLYHCTPGR